MNTQYGFDWGPLTVERVAQDDRIGWVVIVKTSDKEVSVPQIVIRVSPQGKNWSVRTFGKVRVNEN